MLIYVLFLIFTFSKEFLFRTNITQSFRHELYSAEVTDDKVHRLAHEYYKFHG